MNTSSTKSKKVLVKTVFTHLDRPAFRRLVKELKSNPLINKQIYYAGGREIYFRFTSQEEADKFMAATSLIWQREGYSVEYEKGAVSIR